jgi:hypothetical protein
VLYRFARTLCDGLRPLRAGIPDIFGEAFGDTLILFLRGRARTHISGSASNLSGWGDGQAISARCCYYYDGCGSQHLRCRSTSSVVSRPTTHVHQLASVRMQCAQATWRGDLGDGARGDRRGARSGEEGASSSMPAELATSLATSSFLRPAAVGGAKERPHA